MTIRPEPSARRAVNAPRLTLLWVPALLCTIPARAQPAATLPASPPAQATTELDAITVFGSRLRDRSVFDSAVPIDVFTPAAVETALSSGELGQALQALAPSINMPRASSSGTSDSVRAIQLRGLAPDEVLVLIDGKRRHTNAVMDIEGLFPGTVSVDLNAIPAESIDHIEILRDGAGALYGSDAVAGVVNVVLKSGAQGGELAASYGANRTHFAPTGDTLTDGRNRIVSFDYGLPFGAGGAVRFGADYQERGATNRAGRTSSNASYYSTPADVALNNEVLFASGDPELKNRSLFYNATLPLPGAAELYSFSTLNWRNTQGGAFFRYPGDPSNVPSIYPNGFRPVSTGESRDLGVVAGARARQADWKWDLSVREGYNTFSYGLEHSLNASLGPASPTTFHVADFTYEERAVNLDVAKAVTWSPSAEALAVSAGAEYLHQAYHTSPGDPASYAVGPYLASAGLLPGSQGDSGLAPADAARLARHVYSLYADADQQLGRRILVGAAGRYSNYSDFGSATTGKLTARVNLTDDWLVRASLSNSFRAPSLAQTGLRLTTLNLNSSGTGLQTTAFLPPTDPLAQANGGLSLKPEKSVNATAGIAWRHASGLSATLDLYQIRLTDRITPTGQVPVADPSNPTLGAVTFLTNGLDTTTRGLDLVASDTLQLAAGTLRLSAAFNRNYLHVDGLRNALAAPGNQNQTVLIPLEYGSPATKLVLGADWNTQRFGIHVAPVRYGDLYAFTYDSALPTLNGANVQRYGSAWTVDAEAHVEVTPQWTVSIGGTDLFNRYPDQTTPGGTYYGSFPYNYVHPIGINGTYYYARIALKVGR